MTLNPFELHSIVEYIRNVGVDFDAADIDEDFVGVLSQYGVSVASETDLEILRKELLPLGLQRELGEIALTVGGED
jgi:hypothetical protein